MADTTPPKANSRVLDKVRDSYALFRCKANSSQPIAEGLLQLLLDLSQHEPNEIRSHPAHRRHRLRHCLGHSIPSARYHLWSIDRQLQLGKLQCLVILDNQSGRTGLVPGGGE